jgi:RNA polymerase-binding transcription factor DksA
MTQHTENLRYSKQELDEFREIIEKRIAKSQEQLTFYMGQLDELNESSDARIKSLDDGTSAVESVRISTMLQREQKMLQHLDQALLRIKNGT